MNPLPVWLIYELEGKSFFFVGNKQIETSGYSVLKVYTGGILIFQVCVFIYLDVSFTCIYFDIYELVSFSNHKLIE